jgi:hypothetical protein
VSTKDIRLKFPIEHGGATYSTLSFKRPNIGDIEALETRKGGSTKRSIEMLASLAGIDPDVIRKVDMEDMETINDWLEPLLDPKGLRSRNGGD